MCLMMEWDERESKLDEKTSLDVTDFYLIIKCFIDILTYNVWIRDTKTLAGTISGIYMQFVLKWDQIIFLFLKSF